MNLKWPDKDPDEILDYKIDWSERLAGDAIDTSVWTIPTGLTKTTDAKGTDNTTVWLSGGTVSATYIVGNRITTTGGRTMDQSVCLRITSK